MNNCEECDMFWRSGFNYDLEEASQESGLLCKDKSLTVQSQRDEADINLIVKRFGITGELPVRQMPPLEGDFSDAPDFMSAQILMRLASEAFYQQPADIRSRFDNDPGLYVHFVSEANDEQLRELRLLPGLAGRAESSSADAGAGDGSSEGASASAAPK